VPEGDERPVSLYRPKRLFPLVLAATSLSALVIVVFLACQSLNTQYNLYYLLWKAGWRRYESAVALSGMFHDHAFRQSLLGSTVQQFEERFPHSFFKVVKPPPVAKLGQIYMISDLAQSQNSDGHFGLCWLAVFENDRLIEFNFCKA
jgi:hypothetical protein